MTSVWFRCNGRNSQLFRLNAKKELDYVPLVGDIIKTYKNDFMGTPSFRVKPWSNDKTVKGYLKSAIHLDFRVVSRTYSTSQNEWELICEPTSESLMFCLKNVKVKK